MKSWKNWATTTTCKPEKVFFPENISQLQVFVQENEKKDYPLKVVGHSGSYNSNFHTTGALISLKNMNQVHQVDVQANKKMQELQFKIL